MKDLAKLSKKIGVKFTHPEILKTAFVHKSYLNEHKNKGLFDNERLEFLGDAVLELVATGHLFRHYPDQDEGTMTSFRSALVKGKHLAEISQSLELGTYLFLSRGEENSGGREKSYILANTLEALIGAIYLDRGYTAAAKFIQKFILQRLDEIIAKGLHIDAKSSFQEISQERLSITPHYELLSEEGPDHSKNFTMGAYIGAELIAKGHGGSKQKAEDEAAKNALIKKGWN